MRNAKDFGAIGNGIAKDTKAIQDALDAGGMVRLEPGTYLCGTLYLRSNGGLYIEEGATILASPDPEDYNAPDFCPQNRASKSEIASGGHLITAVGQDHITITGGGTIDGNSKAFLNEQDPNIKIWFKRTWRPSQMIFLCESTHIHITNLQIQNSPYWHCFLHGCSFATLSDLNIEGDSRVPNNDGIDIDCCRFVTVQNCNINVGDDCLTLRCYDAPLLKPQPCEYVTFSNCNLHAGYANAIRVGVGSGTIRNCSFSNITIDNTRTAICVVSKYSNTEAPGGNLEQISFNGLQVNCERLANIKLDNNDNLTYPSEATIANIHIANVFGKVELTTNINGNGHGTLKNVDFSNVRLHYEGVGTSPNVNAKGQWGHASTDAAFHITDASGVDFDNCTITFNDHPGWKTMFRTKNAKDIRIQDNCRFTKPLNL